jgi:hypothetical protein
MTRVLLMAAVAFSSIAVVGERAATAEVAGMSGGSGGSGSGSGGGATAGSVGGWSLAPPPKLGGPVAAKRLGHSEAVMAKPSGAWTGEGGAPLVGGAPVARTTAKTDVAATKRQ